MPRTLEDEWNVKNMKVFGDKPSINCVKLTYWKVGEASVLTLKFSDVEILIFIVLVIFALWCEV
jgi:hypothetical protein